MDDVIIDLRVAQVARIFAPCAAWVRNVCWAEPPIRRAHTYLQGIVFFGPPDGGPDSRWRSSGKSRSVIIRSSAPLSRRPPSIKPLGARLVEINIPELLEAIHEQAGLQHFQHVRFRHAQHEQASVDIRDQHGAVVEERVDVPGAAEAEAIA